MILNNQIWKQTIAAAIAAVVGKAEWIRAIERGAKEIERAAYWSFDAQTGVLKIKSTTSGKLYAITANEHTCEATAKYGKRCKHQTALRLLIRYTQGLGVAAAEVETERASVKPSMLAAASQATLVSRTVRGEMHNGMDV